jgi:hypothetical protein
MEVFFLGNQFALSRLTKQTNLKYSLWQTPLWPLG